MAVMWGRGIAFCKVNFSKCTVYMDRELPHPGYELLFQVGDPVEKWTQFLGQNDFEKGCQNDSDASQFHVNDHVDEYALWLVADCKCHDQGFGDRGPPLSIEIANFMSSSELHFLSIYGHPIWSRYGRRQPYSPSHR
jgi:hypothetical protein